MMQAWGLRRVPARGGCVSFWSRCAVFQTRQDRGCANKNAWPGSSPGQAPGATSIPWRCVVQGDCTMRRTPCDPVNVAAGSAAAAEGVGRSNRRLRPRTSISINALIFVWIGRKRLSEGDVGRDFPCDQVRDLLRRRPRRAKWHRLNADTYRRQGWRRLNGGSSWNG